MNEHTIHSMMGAINHWWDGWHRAVELEIDPETNEERIPKDEIPFWVSQLSFTVTSLTGETFDFMTGAWSGD